jgi:transcription-repair coupling factor (superfamily II helicase)
VKDIEHEVLKIVYEDSDTLYVNLNYLGKVRNYTSREGHAPKLTRLGTLEWDRLKSRAKKRIKDLARDLIRLYAKRKASTGFSFQPDTLWQKELEASFMYEDTYDQAKATLDVKNDMEQPIPMDRLVCGDVGFGKTEVAVRAAFKAVMSGTQVAVLVPTTILALQHRNTFVDRLTRFTVRVAMISRLKPRNAQVGVLQELRAGAVDVIIGTHRLLSKDVEFKNLGLLIIDEEHRFGVAAKEKLRHMRSTVDTLTLTATPIPRTLHFSLLGARDMSIIATPPRNRLPIMTEIAQYDEELIREAIQRELDRGGQVYFVHDRVSTIAAVTAKVRTLLPAARVGLAHGQMRARELEDVMLEFQSRNLDILVCTKIVESGLDIPNVNTIIVNRADRFGMSELYQLRGRVGRSNSQAFAYLLVPPPSSLSREAIQRLQALEEFTDLGSGFNLAMRDLEIRGAGNLLGAEQSGFVESMGFETYSRVLDEAVNELKLEEFTELFPDAEKERRRRTEATVELDAEALIPESYIESEVERLNVYRRLYAVTSFEQLKEIGGEMEDRFGPHPPEVANLMKAVRIRQLASRLGFRKVATSGDHLEIELPPESEAEFYDGEVFRLLMSLASDGARRDIRLQQVNDLLMLRIDHQIKESESAEEVAERFLTSLISKTEAM